MLWAYEAPPGHSESWHDCRMGRSPRIALISTVSLAIVSLVSNLQTEAQLESQGVDPVLISMQVLSLLSNGAAWAILLIVAGWSWAGRWWETVMSAVVFGELCLVLHYALALLFDFMDWTDVLANNRWFVAAAIFGIPLGLIGWLAQRRDGLGLLARLTVPVSMCVEPFYTGRFWPNPWLRVSVAIAEQIAAWVELGLGIVALVLIVGIWMKRARRTAFENRLNRGGVDC